MAENNIANFCITPTKGDLKWRIKVAAAILRQYRDTTFSVVSNTKTIVKDGQVIFSLLSPALYSPAGRRRMRFLHKDIVSEKTVIENNQIVTWGARTPHIFSLAANYECQCRCQHCCSDNFRNTDTGQYLSKDKIISVLKEATDLGSTTVILGGGEALLRKDIAQIIGALDKRMATITLFTNGEFLDEEMASRLKQAGVYGVFISIDSSIPQKHDQSRNRPGLFQKAIEAIKTCKKFDIPVGISTVCTKENIHDGDLIKVIDLGKVLDVFEIFILNIIATGKLLDEPQVMLSETERALVLDIVDAYSKDKNYPNIIHEGMLFQLAYPCVKGCPAASIMMHIRADGRVSPCDFIPRFYGDAKEDSLRTIWNRMIADEPFSEFSRGCRMNDLEFRKKYLFKDLLSSEGKVLQY